ncbi:MAG: DegV family protein [Oscillospiraceae bacterium]|jgi:DegV family protein with EDD domain|nr:DegV family protein [Oscillospiraceae bacterium]
MRQEIRLSSDSPADLPQEWYEQTGVATIPLIVNLKGESRKDWQEITPEEIFEVFQAEKIIPTTSAIPVGEYEEFFRCVSEDGQYPVVHFTIGGKISCTYQNACIAAQTLENIYIIDSESMSCGVGLQLIHAAQLRAQGLDAQALAKECDQWKRNVRTTAFLGSPAYMHKSGRCSAVSAMGANLLNIRPVMQMKEGTLSVHKKLRGKPLQVQQQYLEDLLAEPETIDPSLALLYHTGVTEEEFAAALDYVQGRGIFEEIITGRSGSVTSTHIGDKCLLLMFAKKPQQAVAD